MGRQAERSTRIIGFHSRFRNPLIRQRLLSCAVILLDIGLPKLNGYDVCRAIRQHTWGQAIVMIAVTGWGQEEDRRKSKEAGFDGHLTTPVSFDALVRLLSKPTSNAHESNPNFSPG